MSVSRLVSRQARMPNKSEKSSKSSLKFIEGPPQENPLFHPCSTKNCDMRWLKRNIYAGGLKAMQSVIFFILLLLKSKGKKEENVLKSKKFNLIYFKKKNFWWCYHSFFIPHLLLWWCTMMNLPFLFLALYNVMKSHCVKTLALFEFLCQFILRQQLVSQRTTSCSHLNVCSSCWGEFGCSVCWICLDIKFVGRQKRFNVIFESTI